MTITEGRTKKTKEYFAAIEELYAHLSPFAVFDNVVNGVRRKIDVAQDDNRGHPRRHRRRDPEGGAPLIDKEPAEGHAEAQGCPS